MVNVLRLSLSFQALWFYMAADLTDVFKNVEIQCNLID